MGLSTAIMLPLNVFRMLTMERPLRITNLPYAMRIHCAIY